MFDTSIIAKKEVSMKILVTGGAGFIGSHIVDAYIEAGHEVVVVDDLSTGKIENLNPKAKFIQEGIYYSKEMHDIFKYEKFDIVNHHAAQISAALSIEKPKNDVDTNIKGFINILECAKQYGVKKIIFSSSCAVYGNAEIPTSEDCPANPLSPYAISKLAGEYYLKFYNYRYGIDYTILRYANIYGPRQIPNGESGVVAIFTKNLLSEKPSTIYHFGNTKGMIRDYCHVSDIVKANLLVLDKGSKEIYNIGTGVGTYTEDLFFALQKKLHVQSHKGLDYRIARSGELIRSCLDITKAQRELGWYPIVGLN